MDAILEPIGEFWEGFLNNPIVQLASQLIVIYVVLLWLGTAYWAFRDMQARTENPILPYFAAALIIFFTPLLMGLNEEARKSLGAQVPHPARLGEPDEYGALAVHIVENAMLNGETIRLDGAIRMAPR